jgi:hypothetical protein
MTFTYRIGKSFKWDGVMRFVTSLLPYIIFLQALDKSKIREEIRNSKYIKGSFSAGINDTGS